jgi:hypothetical protein
MPGSGEYGPTGHGGVCRGLAVASLISDIDAAPAHDRAGCAGGDLAVLAAWGAAGLIIAIRRFSWLPRAG